MQATPSQYESPKLINKCLNGWGRAQKLCRMVGLLCVVLVVVYLVWFTLSPSLQSRWMLIDDHTIAWNLGSDRSLHASELFPNLMKSEAGRPGLESRYRPAYFFMTLLETMVWGDNTHQWYLSRQLMAAVFLLGVGYVTFELLGALGAVGVVLWVISFPWWMDIWCRLGPAENYCAFGLGIYLLAVVKILRPGFNEISRPLRIGLWIAFVLGNCLMFGSKENWLAILFPNFVIAFLLWRRKRTDLFGWLMLSISIMFNVGVGIATAIGLKNRGHVYADAYGVHVSFADLLSQLPIMIDGMWSALSAPLVIAILLIIWLLTTKFNDPRERARRVISLILGASIFIVFYIWHQLFYAGSWHLAMRYAFPIELLAPGFLVFVLSQVASALSQRVSVTISKTLLSAACLALSVPQWNWGNIEAIRSQSEGYAALSQKFTAFLDEVSQDARNDPNSVVVIEADASGIPWEFEPVISVARYLNLYGLADRTFLRLHGSAKRPPVKVLRDMIGRLSKTGKLRGSTAARIQPIDQLKDQQCISLMITSDTSNLCSTQTRVPL